MPSPWVQVLAAPSRSLLSWLPALVKPHGYWVADGEQKPMDWVLLLPEEERVGSILQKIFTSTMRWASF